MSGDVVESVAVPSADGTAIGVQVTGSGPGLVIVPGTLRAARHYRLLAAALSSDFTVCSMDRRGRGDSGPQGADYGIERECDDLVAVLARTGATMVFGHSYGGLVALEATLRRPAATITKLAVYEPAVSIDGTITSDWLPELDLAVAQDRTVDGVVSVLRGLDLVGPRRHLPVRLQRAVTRAIMHGDTLADMRALLPTASAEVATATTLDSSGAKYAGVGADTLLLCGERGPAYLRHVAQTLDRIIPQARMAVLDKLSHNAPDLDAPEAVAVELRRYFGG